MLKRWASMLMGKTAVAVEQGLGKSYSAEELLGYYNDLTGKVTENTLLDSDGIPLSVVAGGKEVHFPIAVFQYALGCYDLWLQDGDDTHLEAFMKNAEWALNAQREDGSWDTFGPIGSDKYSVSSMAQGEAASVFARAYVVTKDEKFLFGAKDSVAFMLKPMIEGGTAVYEGDNLYLEEYPQDPRRSVLNGWIFSLFGLYDMSLIDSGYRAWFDSSARTMASELHRYDAGYWSYYDLERHIASPAYHGLHIALLEAMNELSGLNEFKDMRDRFEAYGESGFSKYRAIAKKIKQKLVEIPDAVIVK